tara:strand:- start:954 stop:1454 length:501 start_codon:yes stop_codon:yes gene_type:complete
MATILSQIPEGVQRVLARSVGDAFGIAENALEGAVAGGLIGAITSRLYGDKKKTADTKSIKDGAKMGAMHGVVGKVISNIPGNLVTEAHRPDSTFGQLVFDSDTAIGSILRNRANSAGKSVKYPMAKAEKILRSAYTFNRMKTIVKERLKDANQVKKTQHIIKAIK